MVDPEDYDQMNLSTALPPVLVQREKVWRSNLVEQFNCESQDLILEKLPSPLATPSCNRW